MEKQKIVVKVTMNNDKKTRKALKIVVSISGVEYEGFIGLEKEQIAVTGAGIDSVELASLLRKKIGYTKLISIDPVEVKKAESKESSKPAEVTIQVDPYEYYYYNYGVPYYYVHQYY